VTESVLKSWEEVNECLQMIGEAERDLALIDSVMNESIAEAKRRAEEESRQYNDTVKVKAALVQQFVTAHKSELNGKSRKMPFGSVGFRASTSVSLPKDQGAVIQSLKAHGMFDCLTVKTTVNKEILKTYAEKDIMEVGASLKKKDDFWYETAKDTVAEKGA
jgi:phage host-nuclease inhibitor protein Gam